MVGKASSSIIICNIYRLCMAEYGYFLHTFANCLQQQTTRQILAIVAVAGGYSVAYNYNS